MMEMNVLGIIFQSGRGFSNYRQGEEAMMKPSLLLIARYSIQIYLSLQSCKIKIFL